jgi:hypothetical protein
MSLRSRLTGKTKVFMLVSVGDKVAGHFYKVPKDTADTWIAREYCLGKYSRAYTPTEIGEIRAGVQRVNV